MAISPHMQQALALAQRGQGRVEPNPMVGCVIVDAAGDVVGEGFHEKFGGPHAEVNALAAAGERAHGGTAYVTLEPCCHTGKTGPCTVALMQAGIARVVVAMVDPYEKVAGQGLEQLRAGGVEVIVGDGEPAARELNAPFIKRVTTALPWVTLKWAATVDGAIAASSGDSQWISNPESRRIVHQRRAAADAIMVGVGTALKDDPTLTARDVQIHRIARRVVIDPRLQTPETAKLLQTIDAAPVTFAIHEKLLDTPTEKVRHFQSRGVELIGLPPHASQPDTLDLSTLLAHLTEAHAATNVLVEGGAGLNGALLRQRLVDELLVFVGPKLLGDSWGLNAFRLPPSAPPIERMADASPLNLRDVQRIGDDVMLRYLFK